MLIPAPQSSTSMQVRNCSTCSRSAMVRIGPLDVLGCNATGETADAKAKRHAWKQEHKANFEAGFPSLAADHCPGWKPAWE